MPKAIRAVSSRSQAPAWERTGLEALPQNLQEGGKAANPLGPQAGAWEPGELSPYPQHTIQEVTNAQSPPRSTVPFAGPGNGVSLPCPGRFEFKIVTKVGDFQAGASIHVCWRLVEPGNPFLAKGDFDCGSTVICRGGALSRRRDQWRPIDVRG